MICTKIVATLGPATPDVESIHRLLAAGVDVCRLNFSHGSLDQHAATLKLVREAANLYHNPIAILGDLCGPKIRLCTMKEEAGGGVAIRVGQTLHLARSSVGGFVGHTDAAGVVQAAGSYPQLVDDTQVGDPVLVEDGLVKFKCTGKTYQHLTLVCEVGGILKSRKGINLPNTRLSLPSMTDADWQAVDWAIDNDLDYLALSFVRRADDLITLRQHIQNRSADTHIIAKIEMAEALADIDNIIEACDGMMIARGDLGVEMDVAQVPIIQKDLIRRCLSAGRPVIVATQMLQSMIETSTPTRAEVSDVANAIFDGTDAVMLSGETSVGKFPLEAVGIMAHIADVTETYIRTQPVRPAATLRLKTMAVSAAAARGVWQMASDLKPKLVVVWSQTGATARIFSKMRFSVPIIALSSDHRVLRRMALQYGVLPAEMPAPGSTTELLADIDELLLNRKLAALGDRILVVAGAAMGTPGTMDGILIHTVHTATPMAIPGTQLDQLTA